MLSTVKKLFCSLQKSIRLTADNQYSYQAIGKWNWESSFWLDQQKMLCQKREFCFIHMQSGFWRQENEALAHLNKTEAKVKGTVTILCFISSGGIIFFEDF